MYRRPLPFSHSCVDLLQCRLDYGPSTKDPTTESPYRISKVLRGRDERIPNLHSKTKQSFRCKLGRFFSVYYTVTLPLVGGSPPSVHTVRSVGT